MVPRPKSKQEVMSDFEARKKLLSASEPKKTKKKKKTAKNGSSSAVLTKTTAEETDPLHPVAEPTVDNTTSSLYNGGLGAGMGMMGGGMLGMGGMYGGMYGSPYGMGMGFGMGPLNTLNQFLMGVQTAIYSLNSAVQVIGMNKQALHQLLDAASSMVEHALATWHEMRALEAIAKDQETEEQKMRRRRLKALRWAMVVAATYAAWRVIRSAFSSRKHRRRNLTSATETSYASYSNQAMTPYNGGGYNSSPYSTSGYGMSPYNSSGMGGMYGAGGGYGQSYGGGFY